MGVDLLVILIVVVAGLALNEYFSDKAIDGDPDVYVENFWNAESEDEHVKN